MVHLQMIRVLIFLLFIMFPDAGQYEKAALRPFSNDAASLPENQVVVPATRRPKTRSTPPADEKCLVAQTPKLPKIRSELTAKRGVYPPAPRIIGYNPLDGPQTSEAPVSSTLAPRRYDPHFDETTPKNVTSSVGKSAYLSCRVRNIGNKTVSWVRHRDIHILTVGSYTYTSDQRFQTTHHHETDDWVLQIKWAQKRDSGIYECQISTIPLQSYFITLTVVVPTASILGGPDLHVDKGSTINLTCSIRFSPEPPAYIFWYHHDDVISYDSARGGVTVITEKGDTTTSFLLIRHADVADSGKYSCSPSNADVASVRVHVLNGETPAAMQTGSAGLPNISVTVVAALFTMVASR